MKQIPLRDKNKNIVDYALVSDEDFEHLNQYKWYKSKDGYVQGTFNKKGWLMHRYIVLNILKQIWEQEGIFIMIYNLERLQFNILEHTYVPKHTILNDEEVNDMKKRYNIINDKQLPEKFTGIQE